LRRVKPEKERERKREKKMSKTYEGLVTELKTIADRAVPQAASYAELRFICRAYRTNGIKANIDKLAHNPGLTEELTERALLLYHICLEKVNILGEEKIKKMEEGETAYRENAKKIDQERNSRIVIPPFGINC
jgi:hypothetical protein